MKMTENETMRFVLLILGFIMNKQLVSKQDIIHCLKANYGIPVSTLMPITDGADLFSEAYKAETTNQISYFVKLKQGIHHAIGISLQQLLHNADIQQIISPIKTIDNKLSQIFNDFTLIVYPFINGQNGFDRNLNKDQWIELGNALKQIHEFNVPLSIKKKIRHESYSSKWREAVRSIYDRIDSEKSDDPIIQELLVFMKNHKETILRLVNAAEKLSKKIQKKDPGFVLCHSDIHAGNVLIQDDGKIYIVDWDSPIMAPKERDLMFIGGGVGNVWNNPREVEFFYQGYRIAAVDMEILYYYRCDRILEDIAIYYQDLLSSGKDNKAEIYTLLTDIFKPKGVVDIALEAEKFL